MKVGAPTGLATSAVLPLGTGVGLIVEAPVGAHAHDAKHVSCQMSFIFVISGLRYRCVCAQGLCVNCKLSWPRNCARILFALWRGVSGPSVASCRRIRSCTDNVSVLQPGSIPSASMTGVEHAFEVVAQGLAPLRKRAADQRRKGRHML